MATLGRVLLAPVRWAAPCYPYPVPPTQLALGTGLCMARWAIAAGTEAREIGRAAH
ncbi:hypothetical protein BD626DRAFT_509260 [Schizophyllum amplum]|uniref:Uncharacterized protein n=1 Tax=Schizophyllum amplum TaxID=97359 RepID=A0A550C301_9AGAR|nr:hypothetical protein BD626DRAFT_509260 [Auriculariopsis ampla]